MSAILEIDRQAIYNNTIRNIYANTQETYNYYPVAIIGAGKSGIAAGCRLKEEYGFDQFRIFDKQSGVGGKWWINRYPGAAFKDPAVYYSFSFFPNFNKTSSPPTRSDILNYLRGVCENYQIVDKIQLNTEVQECRWLESEQIWELELCHITNQAGDLSNYDRSQKIRVHGRGSVYLHKERIRAKILISAVGCLIEPEQTPEEIPGIEIFKGEIFCSSRWRYDIDLTDKEVIVVGTGCNATQFVPLLVNDYNARSVTQLMQSPPWVIPLDSSPSNLNYGWKTWLLWLTRSKFGIRRFMYYLTSRGFENDWKLLGPSECIEKQRKKFETDLLVHMRNTVPRKYHEILTPNTDFECSHQVFDTAWLQSLNDPAVTLTTLPLSSVGETEVTLGPGRMYPDCKDSNSKAPNHKVVIPADVIILANEFHNGSWLYPLKVIGRGEKRLHERLEESGRQKIYMGMAFEGFPNFLTIFGQNTLTGNNSTLVTMENALSLGLKLIRPVIEDEALMFEIKQEAELMWAREAKIALNKRTLNINRSDFSSYSCESGRNMTDYRYSQIWVTLHSMFPTWNDWNITYTTKGQLRNLARNFLHTTFFTSIIWGIVQLRAKQSPISAVVKNFVQASLFASSNILHFLGGRIQ